MTHLDRAEQRRLLRSLATTVALQNPRQIGSLDGPGEDRAVGRFTGVTLSGIATAAGTAGLAAGLARLLVHHPGHDLDRALADHGWARQNVDGRVGWRQEHAADGVALAFGDIQLARASVMPDTPRAGEP
jgi:hypothetical protein